MTGIKSALKFGSIATIGAMVAIVIGSEAFAEENQNANITAGSPNDAAAKFRQLDHVLPSPNIYRSASGAPGPAYWQQSANYKMNIRLDEEERRKYHTQLSER